MTAEQLFALAEASPITRYSLYFFWFNTALVVVEMVLDVFTSKERRWKDTGANWFIFVVEVLLAQTLYGIVGLLCLLPFHWWTPLSIPMTFWTWILAFFAADFTYYWMHRLEHEHRILWASHSVHHSSEDYNLSVSLRLSVVESLFEWAFLIPMMLLGFSPFQTLAAFIFVVQYQSWVHTEYIKKLGWLDVVFNTPSVHRVHHGSNKTYLDKNYGGVLMIWDHLFGTFQKEEEPVVYGLTQNINTNNPWRINFIEYQNIWRDVKRCRTWKDRLRMLFGGLTWRPDYLREDAKEERPKIP